jgi:hypothetical protein
VPQTLYWLDLNTSFPVEGYIASNSLNSVRADGNQWTYEGAFFKSVNGTILYRFGGYPPDDAGMVDSVVTYNTVSGAFDSIPVSGGSFNKMSNVQEMAANSDATGEGLGFYTGRFTEYNGMVQFNTSDAEHPTWVNQSVGEVGPTAGGQMQFVRFGERDALVAVGGYNVNHYYRSNNKVQYIASHHRSSLR